MWKSIGGNKVNHQTRHKIEVVVLLNAIHMTGAFRRVADVFLERGIMQFSIDALAAGYAHIRPWLPAIGFQTLNEIPVRERKILDPTVPDNLKKYSRIGPDKPGYESITVQNLREYVDSGDTVIVVGGGHGVSSIVAAHQTGPSGKVIVYEGSASYCESIKTSIGINKVSDIITVHHAIVASYSRYSRETFGSPENASHISPDSLPRCDVLELDCEGAETEIIENMLISPRTILVETHGFIGSSEDDVRGALTRAGYEVIDRTEGNGERGIHDLVAIRANRPDR